MFCPRSNHDSDRLDILVDACNCTCRRLWYFVIVDHPREVGKPEISFPPNPVAALPDVCIRILLVADPGEIVG